MEDVANKDGRLNNPELIMIRIVVLVLLCVIGLLVLVILGSYRRRSRSQAVRVSVWVAYTACVPMVSYTLGLMQSNSDRSSLFSVWAVIVFIFLGSVDSLSAYSLQDNDDWKRFFLEQVIQSFWVGWLMESSYRTSEVQRGEQHLMAIWIIFYIVLLKYGTRMASFKLASARLKLSESTKWVADYMSYEHEGPSGVPVDWDPVTMRGYRYVVAGEDKQKPKVEPPAYLLKYSDNDRAKLVTVEQIWGCDGRLLSGDGGNRLKDVCLSMALSKMLNRRFAGFQELAVSNLPKTRDFLFRGLLHGDSSLSYTERAFRVIEVELAFVHDYFYTKYFIIYNTGHLFILLSFAVIPICGWLAAELYFTYENKANMEKVFWLITFVIVLAIALVEGLQVYIYLASAWSKVALVSGYTIRDSWKNLEWLANLIGFITSLKFVRSWEDKLGQYTLLENFDYRPINILHYVTFFLVDVNKKGRKEGKRVRLSIDVKEAVTQTLRRSNGELTNGVTSLQANGVFQQLSWSCTSLATTTHTILVWHIATTLCEVQDPVHQRSEEVRNIEITRRHVASSLSKYCAYLVAFAPKLLPDHNFVSQTIFNAVVDEAHKLLHGVKKLHGRCEKLKETAAAAPNDGRLVVLGAYTTKNRSLIQGPKNL